MTADLITRARSAETRDEECAVIRDAIYQFITDGDTALALLGIIVAVLSGRAPRAVLLGVVAALVPEGWGFVGARDHDTLAAYGNAFHPSINEGRDPADMVCSGDCHRGSTAALALLIAVLEAANG
ncbi:hypothetical protein [Azospirillum sp. TSO5]|uniref:hypothetical protein n=1 Tax=Azospirillum sp. TSO5 TaxID=716760 RepID=UPI000D60DC3F|nr:hypothetical protein [Azospirillum sp. TSO5]PWC96905.1 hypothetical protein TSO5_05570 [Azospirillum sp. TSO5]